MATINMSKKQKISMTKEDGSAVKNFFYWCELGAK